MFPFGFAKNERDNVSDAQLADFKAAAGEILTRSRDAIAEDIFAGRLLELDYDQ